jgi:hypothetical protein
VGKSTLGVMMAEVRRGLDVCRGMFPGGRSRFFTAR